MSEPLDITFAMLEKTGNEASVAVLMAALRNKQWKIQEPALRAILGRRSPAAHRQLILRWNDLPDRMRQVIQERSDHLSGAVRDAILGSNEKLNREGCDAVLCLRDFDLLPALVTAVEDEANSQRELAGQTLFRLIEMLHEDLATSAKAKSGRDPRAVRPQALTTLETSVSRYSNHQRPEILEAFLLIVGRDNSTLKHILNCPHDCRFLKVVDLLATSTQPGILRLLLSFLDDAHAPSSVLGILARRDDQAFIQRLMAKIGFEPSKQAKHNIKRIKSIPWLDKDLGFLDDFDDAEQHSAVQLVMTSGVNRLKSFKVVQYLLQNGKPGGRRAASHVLAEFRGSEANELAVEKLQDEDPQVQANLLSQIRERGIPGAMLRLIKMIDSPHEIVRSAARANLEEFSIERFFAAYDMLEEDVRKSTGQLVKRVDLQTIPKITKELNSRSRTHRLRALGIAAAVEAVPELESAIVPLLNEADHFLRAEAATALAGSSSDKARRALRKALADPNFTVQQAAQQSLDRMSAAPETDSPAAITDSTIFPTETYFPGAKESLQ
ncbi:MAG: hypothetical protein IH991_08285 [Planctomycetes bacterium]|nr:hypothetical protein [Planctomycetota bacterium]